MRRWRRSIRAGQRRGVSRPAGAGRRDHGAGAGARRPSHARHAAQRVRAAVHVVAYGVDRESYLVDMDALERTAQESRPRLAIAGWTPPRSPRPSGTVPSMGFAGGAVGPARTIVAATGEPFWACGAVRSLAPRPAGSPTRLDSASKPSRARRGFGPCDGAISAGVGWGYLAGRAGRRSPGPRMCPVSGRRSRDRRCRPGRSATE
jgi:hypothetical protein